MSEDKLFCREAYLDGEAANAHLKNVGALIGEILADGVAKLDSIEIHGDAKELELVKPTKDLGTKYFEVHSGFTNMKSVGTQDKAYGFVSIHPTFSRRRQGEGASDHETIRGGHQEQRDRCIYYGWTICGDKLFCREAYVDGAAANAHLKNVGSLIGEIFGRRCCQVGFDRDSR